MGHLFHIPHGLDDPTLWVLVALILFLALVVYLKLPGMITKALDERAAKIAAELDEAKRMREETTTLEEDPSPRNHSPEQTSRMQSITATSLSTWYPAARATPAAASRPACGGRRASRGRSWRRSGAR